MAQVSIYILIFNRTNYLFDSVNNVLQQTYSTFELIICDDALFRRTCLKEVNYMRPEADGCEDFDLLVGLALAGKQGYFLPDFLMEYRFHPAQTSLKLRDSFFVR